MRKSLPLHRGLAGAPLAIIVSGASSAGIGDLGWRSAPMPRVEGDKGGFDPDTFKLVAYNPLSTRQVARVEACHGRKLVAHRSPPAGRDRWLLPQTSATTGWDAAEEAAQ